MEPRGALLPTAFPRSALGRPALARSVLARSARSSLARSARSALALLALGLAGCDHFDFGRLFGGEPAEPTPSARPAPSETAKPPSDGRAERLVMVLGGDVNFDEIAKDALDPAKGAGPLAGVAPLFHRGNVRIVHLVSPLTERKVPSWGRPRYVGLPSAVEPLAQLGVDAVAIATDRAWDATKDGFFDTLKALGEAGLPVAGGGRDAEAARRPATVLAEGWTVSLLSVTRDWPHGPLPRHQAHAFIAGLDVDRLHEDIRTADASSDLVVVSMSSMKDAGKDTTPEDERALLRGFVEAGADVVLGRGSGVPRGIGWEGGVPVIYGLGNLLGSADPAHPWTARGFVVDITFSSGKKAPPALRACPYRLDAGAPVLLEGGKRQMQEQIFRRNLSRLSEGEDGSKIGPAERYACLSVRPAREGGSDGG